MMRDFEDLLNVFIIEGVEDDLTVTAGSDEFGELESFELVRNSGFSEVQENGEVTDAEFLTAKDVHDADAGGISEMFKEIGEFFISFGGKHHGASGVDGLFMNDFAVAS